jgi:CelD/BcsL family acetyltransferase involved in cellulose biosynthesis
MTALVTRLTTTLLIGREVLDDLGAEFDALAADTRAPVTNRRPWLEAWIEAYPEIEVWAFACRTKDRLVGACLLAARQRGEALELIGLGHGRNDRSWFYLADTAAAEATAEAIAGRLEQLSQPWTLRIEQLSAGEELADALVRRLPAIRLVPGRDIPGVDFGQAGSVEAHLSKNLRKQLRKCRNRLADDGIDFDITFTRVTEELQALLPEVETVHRQRDHDVGRTSDIDDICGRALWQGLIACHIKMGVVEIASLRLEQELAAYVVSFIDGDSYRVLDGRFTTKWERYSPGRILETETLAYAMTYPLVTRLDWMNSVAPDKLIACNNIEHTLDLVGGSTTGADAKS